MDKMKYSEMKYILNLTGYTQKEFCNYINKSKSFLNNCLRKKNEIPIRYVKDFESFLGKELYNYGRTRYYDKLAKKYFGSTKLS